MSNIAFVEEWFEQVWNRNNASHIDKYLADDCDVCGLDGTEICCPADFHRFHQSINQGFADIRCEVEWAIEAEDEVAGIAKVNAIHRKTGKPVEFHTSFIGSVKDGKFRKIRNTVNFLDAMIQIDAVPPDLMEKALG